MNRKLRLLSALVLGSFVLPSVLFSENYFIRPKDMGGRKMDVWVVFKSQKAYDEAMVPGVSKLASEDRDSAIQNVPSQDSQSDLQTQAEADTSFMQSPDTLLTPSNFPNSDSAVLTEANPNSAPLEIEAAVPDAGARNPEGLISSPSPAIDFCGDIAMGLGRGILGDCRHSLIKPSANKVEKYLYRMLLNLKTSSEEGFLSPVSVVEESPQTIPEKDLLIIDVGSQSLQYLVFRQGRTKPVAGGAIKEPFGSKAISLIVEDLLNPNSSLDKSPDVELGQGIDLFVGVGLGFILNTGGKEDNQFDMVDLASVSGIPFNLKGGIVVKDCFGLRASWKRVGFSANQEIVFQIGGVSDWQIIRNDILVEILLGKSGNINKTASYFLYGMGGIGQSFFSDEVDFFDGSRYQGESLLDDVLTLKIGLGGNFRPMVFIGLSLEGGIQIREFDFRDTSDDPDGSASEIFLEINLNGMGRIIK